MDFKKGDVMKVIFETPCKTYRIVEHRDYNPNLDHLKGDSYCPKANPSINPKQLAKEEVEFETLVDNMGVYGYVLEKFDSQSKEYSWFNSCWDFVGAYDTAHANFNHYIVDEYKDQIQRELAANTCEYTASQLDRIKVDSPTISVVFHDYDGNATKYLGVNSLQSVNEFRKFLDAREAVLFERNLIEQNKEGSNE